MDEDMKRDTKEALKRSIRRFIYDSAPEEFPDWRFMKVPGLENKVTTILIPISIIEKYKGNNDKINLIVREIYSSIAVIQKSLDPELIENIGRGLKEQDKYNYLNQLSIYILLQLIKEYMRRKNENALKTKVGHQKEGGADKLGSKKIFNSANKTRIRLCIENFLQDNIDGLYIYNDMISWGQAQYQFISEFESMEKAKIEQASSDCMNKEADNIEQDLTNCEKINKLKLLFRHYLEDLSWTIIKNMNLSNMELQDIEVLLRIKNINKNNDSIGLEKLMKESLSASIKSNDNFDESGSRLYKVSAPLVSIPSSKLYHEISTIIAAKGFKKIEGRKWYHATLKNSTNIFDLLPNLIIRMSESDKDITGDAYTAHLETIKKYAEEMGDLTVDILDAIYIILLKEAKTVSGWVKIYADSILKLRGIKPKTSGDGRQGGYKDEQRQEVIEHIKILASILVNQEYITTNGQKKVTPSPLIEISKDSEEYINPYLFNIKAGKAISMLIRKKNRNTALISQRVLNYSPLNYQLEKRLARYFAWLWRIRQQKSNYFEPIKVETMMEHISWNGFRWSKLKINDKIINALDKLKKDGVIADWNSYYKYGSIDDEKENNDNDYVLDKSVIIEPPQNILEHYREIKNKEVNNLKANSEDTSHVNLITQVRKNNDYTYVVLADQIKVLPGSLYKFEAGDFKQIPQDDKKRIEKWIKKMLEQYRPQKKLRRQ